MDRLEYQRRIEQLMRENNWTRAEAVRWIVQNEPTLVLLALAEQFDAGYPR